MLDPSFPQKYSELEVLSAHVAKHTAKQPAPLPGGPGMRDLDDNRRCHEQMLSGASFLLADVIHTVFNGFEKIRLEAHLTTGEKVACRLRKK